MSKFTEKISNYFIEESEEMTMEEAKKKCIKDGLCIAGGIIVTAMIFFSAGKAKGSQLNAIGLIRAMGFDEANKGDAFVCHGTMEEVKNFMDSKKVSNPNLDFNDVGVLFAISNKQ